MIYVKRWKKDGSGSKVLSNGKPVIEFVAIKRKDTGHWAIPGVMINNLFQVITANIFRVWLKQVTQSLQL